MQIKAYSKKELAVAYSPEVSVGTALNRLAGWIALNPYLSDELSALGYQKSQRIFTVKMVERIFHHLGEP